MGRKPHNILAADIGGTSARFARFEGLGPDSLVMRESVWLETAESSSFGGLLDMLRVSGFPLAPGDADVFSLALAGPVVEGVKSFPPNISWDLDLSNARKDYGFERFALINDFTAQAYACRSPAVAKARIILPGEADPKGVVAAVGAGTGLGKAALLPDGRGGWLAMPSEGGHELFPFAGDEEFEYFRFMRKTLGREQIIGDLVVSGTGLSLLHRFLTGRELSPGQVAEGLKDNPRTLEMFARFYGRVCRDYVLVALAQGGLYVCGGVAARNPGIVDNEHFKGEFRASETHGRLLARIPVFLNDNQDSGLFGAAVFGLRRLSLT